MFNERSNKNAIFGKIDNCTMGQIVKDAILSWSKRRVLFNFEDAILVCDFRFSFSYFCWFGMEHANGKKVGRMVNYIERVFETRKSTMLCWPCAYGVAKTKRTKREEGGVSFFMLVFVERNGNSGW